jgi:hypothetical protein
LNVRIVGRYPTWEWRVRHDLFDLSTRRVECYVEDVRGIIIFLENPATSWNEGHDGLRYLDEKMLEIICSELIESIEPYKEVRLEVDCSELAQP